MPAVAFYVHGACVLRGRIVSLCVGLGNLDGLRTTDYGLRTTDYGLESHCFIGSRNAFKQSVFRNRHDGAEDGLASRQLSPMVFRVGGDEPQHFVGGETAEVGVGQPAASFRSRLREACFEAVGVGA